MTIESESLDSILQRYADAAAAHGKASKRGDFKTANQQHNIIAAAYRELRRRGLDSQLALLPLLKHDDGHVRVWAAAHALEFAPAEGEATLQELRSAGGMSGFDAEMTLEEWRKGALQFPRILDSARGI